MTTFRATQVEAYRRFRNSEWTTYEELIATLKGELVANEAMKFGTAVHAALEKYLVSKQELQVLTDVYTKDYKFAPASIKLATEGLDHNASCETKVSRTIYAEDGTELTLTGTCDVITGTHVIDYKTTMNSISDAKIQSYEASYQWRCYLAMTGCDTFTFRIMQWAEDAGFWYIKNMQDVRCDRYIGMIDDVERMVRELYQFTKQCEELP